MLSTKKQSGRKPLWEQLDMPSRLDSIKGWAMQGSTDKEICEMLGISHDTFYKWKADKPEFAEAIKRGKFDSNGEILNSAFKQATGFYYTQQEVVKLRINQFEEKYEIVEVEKYQPPNPTMSIFMMKNRMPEHYKDKQQHEVSGVDGQPIQAVFHMPRPHKDTES